MTNANLAQAHVQSDLVENLTERGDGKLNLKGEIHELLTRLGESRVEPVAYDTAWVARLGEIDSELSKQALEWLRAHQLPDGGWGAPTPLYHHDRVICTLAAIIALAHNGAPEDQLRIRAALPALQHSLANLHQDIAGRTIAFEMLLPSMVAEAETLGLTIDDLDGTVRRMSHLRDAKLARAPKGLINRHTTLGFSAEMVGPAGLHLLEMDNLQYSDGSVYFNPAATAFFIRYVRPDPVSLQYLHRVTQGGGAPSITAIDIFERGWVLWNFSRGHISNPTLLAHSDVILDELMASWHPSHGIATDSSFAVPDGDDTGLVFELLAKFGRNPDLAAIWHYEEDSYFRCLDLETHSSISTNIHILGALRQADFSTNHPAIQKIAAFLRREQTPLLFWVDKWHASPYYPTCHAIIVCAGYLNGLVTGAIDWLLHTQNPDGSWGYFSPTAEETAYCLQALMAWHKQGASIPKDALRRGAMWLARNSEPTYSPLWIGKCLYCPTLVVRSAILGALSQYESEFGTIF